MVTGLSHSTEISLPCRVQVHSLVSSRYDSAAGRRAERPDSWDQRIAGIDVIELLVGGTIRLRSSAMQSPPKPGWVLLLSGGNAGEGYSWTLYGLAPRQ